MTKPLWIPDGDNSWIDIDVNDNRNVVTCKRVEDIAPLLNENALLKEDPRNGFTDNRSFRRVGSIPPTRVLRDVMPAMKKLELEYSGNDLVTARSKWYREYLNKHPEFRTVDKMVSHQANEGNIIIK